MIEPVASWLDAHAPEWTVQIDRRDWGEGFPDFIIQGSEQGDRRRLHPGIRRAGQGKHTFSDDETVIEFTPTTTVFADGIDPKPKMVAWLEANVPGHRLV